MIYTRYHVQGYAGVDDSASGMSHIPGSKRACFGFCFPPTQMVGVFLEHLLMCRARTVVIVRDRKHFRFPLLVSPKFVLGVFRFRAGLLLGASSKGATALQAMGHHCS